MDTFNKEVILLLRNDDETAFQLIYKSWYERLLYFAIEYIKDEGDAENIVQDVFLVFWKKRKTLYSDSNINAYLYTITKNLCLKYLRDLKASRKHEDTYGNLALDYANNYFALERLETSELTFFELQKLVDQTIKGLSPRCQEVFKLSRFEGLKNREIADKLEISLKAVEANITRAIKILKVALKDYLPIVAFLFVSANR